MDATRAARRGRLTALRGGCFVAGTGTGVGKTVVAAALLAALRARGLRVAAHKPVLTGLDDPPDPVWPRDHELLAAAAGMVPDAVAPVRFGPAVSPHLAVALAGRPPLDPAVLLASARAAGTGADGLVVEGVGGLLVPLAGAYLVRDLARELALPLVLVARAGLGTVNHTLLTLEAARTAGLQVAGVVLGPWPADPGPLLRSNRETIERLGGAPVAVMAELATPEVGALAAAGEALPLDAWLFRSRPPRVALPS